jgi:hypothetical protein
MTAPRLSAGGLSVALYDHFRDILLEDTTIFLQFYKISAVTVARGRLPPAQARAALSSCWLLAMVKLVVDGLDGVCPLAFAEVFQRLIFRAITLQIRDTFYEYFLSFTVSGCHTGQL